MAVILAEISGNHNGDLAKAKELIRSAAKAGCDAVKFQLYKPEDLCDPANNHIYEKYQVPVDWLQDLFATAAHVEIKLFASIFAPWAVEALEPFKPFAYKIASPESTRLPAYSDLIDAIKATGKRLIASSGRNDMNMVHALCPDVLLYCVAGYPATVTDDDIEYFRTNAPLQRTHRGFSDHSNDLKTPLAMIAAGAAYIEKHFKIEENCIDAAFSFNPEQMKLLCGIAHA